MINSEVSSAIDLIDAAFFSGDTFHNRQSHDEIGISLGRWTREHDNIKIVMEEEAKEANTLNEEWRNGQ